MSKKQVVILGGIGGGQIAAAVIQDLSRIDDSWELVGLLNDNAEVGSNLGKFPVVGRTDDAIEFAEKGYLIHYALHNAKKGHLRMQRFLDMHIAEDQIPNIIHPTAYTGMLESIGYGVLMAPYVNGSYGASVGNCNHFYGNSFLGHDCVVGSFVSVSNSASIGGNVVVKDGCHIGTNSSIRENITIGKYAVIGIGAVVLKDVCDKEVVVGNPARVLCTVDQYDE